MASPLPHKKSVRVVWQHYPICVSMGNKWCTQTSCNPSLKPKGLSNTPNTSNSTQNTDSYDSWHSILL